MRRTYRSKKDSGGALDFREVVQNLEEKSSVFDAFYIQNIKQSKREQSCMGSSNQYSVASNKVRKRKYVKRIVKDQIPAIRESINESAYLTPDKSLRVNKAPDLFDQLLNSSPMITPTLRRHSDLNSSTPNASLVMKSNFMPNRKCNKFGRKRIAKVKKYKYSSSESSESDKENSKENSIHQNETDIKSYELPIEKEEKHEFKEVDASIINIVKNITLLNKLKDRGPNYHLINNSLQNQSLNKKKKSPIVNSPLCSTPFKDKYRGKSIYNFSPIFMKDEGGDGETSQNYVTIVHDSNHDCNDNLPKDSEKIVHEGITGSPIFPISQKSFKNREKWDSLVRTLQSVYNVSDKENISKVENEQGVENDIKGKNLQESESSSLQITETEPFLGFTNSSTNNNRALQLTIERIDEIKERSDKIPLEGSKSKSDISNRSDRNQSVFIVSELECDDKLSDESSNSSYGSCDGDDSASDECHLDAKEPVVKISKLSDSIFFKYYKVMPNNEVEEDTKPTDESIDSNSFNSLNNTANSIQIDVNDGNTSADIFSSEENPTDVKVKEEDKCVSFVTTRRGKKGVYNDSSIILLDNSSGSNSSSECNDTVLCNKETVNIEDLKPGSSKNLIEYEVQPEKCVPIAKDNADHSCITMRNSSVFKESFAESSESGIINTKPSIVLQPGKKWERSLSIYRRMTTMADHINQSLLDESLKGKGRKYRQSVIDTMGMQDCSGSLHNESINSRRSTFVSRPNRSTIRIVKEANDSRISLSTTATYDDLKGFLDDCDDTIVELSKLSITDDQEVTVIEQFHDTSNRVATARDYVLRRCNQTEPLLFDECYPETVLKNCHKIGEGVYGEVYLWRAGDGRVRVMKIVPIAGTIKVNGEPQKDFHEIISEVVIAMELSALRAPIADIERHFDEGKDIETLDLHSIENATDVFNEVLAVRCVYGSYPSRLLDLWELYDECKGSENDNPAALPVDQQYMVLELANAGQDLESYQFNSAEQAHALFLQLAFGLAVGEEAFQFEHRDLHWGNVLISPTDQKCATFVLRGRAHRVCRRGVAASVIDYSLSRVSLRPRAALYADLARDDALFSAVGDYQFHVYRLMREKLGNEWKNFEPYTNILWLHYIADKMITALRYKRTNTKIHKHYISKLKGIKNRILTYGSSVQFVLTDSEY